MRNWRENPLFKEVPLRFLIISVPNTGSHAKYHPRFGFVQLSSWGNAINNPPKTGVDPGVATVRWAQRQTNDRVAKTFMATAIDLAAYEGGCGRDGFPAGLCIHPGYKQPVGARLTRGALLGSTCFGKKLRFVGSQSVHNPRIAAIAAASRHTAPWS